MAPRTCTQCQRAIRSRTREDWFCPRLCAPCVRARMRELGIPREQGVRHIWDAHPEPHPDGIIDPVAAGLSSYRLELFGVHLGTLPRDAGVPGPLVRVPGPPAPGPDMVMQVWQQVISPPGSPVTLDARWHPTHGENIAIRGIESAHNQDDVLAAHRGVGLLRRPERPGKPLGAGKAFDSKDAFLTELAAAYRRLRQGTQSRRRFGAERLAETMGVSTSTFYKYLDDLGLGRPADALKAALGTSSD